MYVMSSYFESLSCWPVLIARQEKGDGHRQCPVRNSAWIHCMQRGEPSLSELLHGIAEETRRVLLNVFMITCQKPKLSLWDSVLHHVLIYSLLSDLGVRYTLDSSTDISREHFPSCILGQSTVMISKWRASFVRKLVLEEVRTGVYFIVIIIKGDFSDLKSLSLIHFDEFIILICPWIL